MSEDNRVIKSYVWHEGKCFFVSTIGRDSSAVGGRDRYNETMAWEYDWDKAERGAMIGQEEASRFSINGHFSMCKKLFATGRIEEEENI